MLAGDTVDIPQPVEILGPQLFPQHLPDFRPGFAAR
jgi:hypothetical protein